MKRTIDPLAHASEIMKAVENGVLITAKKDSRVNPMTVSWGGLAIEWGKPLFIAFVRKTRYTKEFLDATGEFTVNLPQGAFDKKITALCGSKSGRDIDKVKAAGLTLECRILHACEQDIDTIDGPSAERWYPSDETGERNPHTAYYAEIVAAYVIE